MIATAHQLQQTAASKMGQVPISHLPLDGIRPSPENDQLYRPINPVDPQIARLADSIGQHGIQEPLLVTQDRWIISGHRRFAAAGLAGLTTVPCRVAPIVKDADHDQFMMLLRECNRQRVKSFDEILREEVVSVNREQAYRSLIAHRSQRSAIGADRMAISGAARRAEITDAKMPFVDAINEVLADLAGFAPLSARQIHYALLNDPPLRHAGKPDSAYRNDKASYKSLTELLTRARLAGLVPMEAIADETRPVTTWRVYRDVQDYIGDELNTFLQSYWRDLLASQPNHIELVIEKNTVAPILMPIAEKYCMPTTVGRGYCSLPPRRDMAARFLRSGKEKFVLLVVSDFDPDGEEIAHSLARSLRDDFGVRGIEPVKAALTVEQVEWFNLVGDAEAKRSSSNYRKFVDQFGMGVFELEALQPAQLQTVVQATIDSVLDVEAFNAELEQEKSDAESLAGVRSVVRQALLNRPNEEGGL